MPTLEKQVACRANGMTRWAKVRDDDLIPLDLSPIKADDVRKDLLERFDRAIETFEKYSLKRFLGGFFVTSPTGARYLTRLSTFKRAGHCTCPDFEKRKAPCKHIYMLLIKLSKIGDST